MGGAEILGCLPQNASGYKSRGAAASEGLAVVAVGFAEIRNKEPCEATGAVCEGAGKPQN